jgi:hypothetical protein
MLRDAAAVLMVASACILIFGVAWSVYIAVCMRKWIWLAFLLLFTIIAYPIFAIVYRKSTRPPFHAFWVGTALLVVGMVILS